MVLATYALLSLVALVSVYGYEFDDPYYNDLLIEDLNDAYLQLTKRSLHPRDRREVSEEEDHKCHHHPWGHRKLCCGEEIIKKKSKEHRQQKRECFKEIMEKDGGEPRDPFSCEDVEKRKKQFMCAMQCVGQKKKFLDGDGNPIRDELTKKFTEESFLADAPWLKDRHEDIINKCLAEVEEAKAKSTEGSCGPAGIVLEHCFSREFQLSCPESEIKDQEACDKFKQRMKNKKLGFFGPPPPPQSDSDE